MNCIATVDMVTNVEGICSMNRFMVLMLQECFPGIALFTNEFIVERFVAIARLGLLVDLSDCS